MSLTKENFLKHRLSEQSKHNKKTDQDEQAVEGH